jgi:thioredoxin reductase (NADPH)
MSEESILTNEETAGIYDVIVIGGGPAGLSAAIYTSRSGLRTIVIDKNPSAGALGSAHKIENYPGMASPLSGGDLLAVFREQAESFGAEIIKDQVMGVDFESDPKEVFTNSGSFHAKTVIIATGSMGRKPSLEGEERLRGRGVSYCATCDAPFYKNREVAVAGELAQIVEEIDHISKFAKRVHIITPSRSATSEEDEILGRHPNIELRLGCNMKEIRGSEKVESILISCAHGAEEEIPIEGIFIYLRGNQPVVDYLYGAVEMTDGCIISNSRDMSTSVKGVYAVGDVTCKKIRQVVVSASEGCIAALSAEQYIYQRDRVRTQWSTTGKA